MFNQGLNAGIDDDYDTDLDLVPQIVETIGTGAPPEYEEEAQTISAMEARIEDLLVLRAQIHHQRGMSQALAIEGLRIMPEFGEGAPASFYSLQPGATRLAIASESIIRGIWEAIKTAIAALRAMIRKFINWLRGGTADDAGGLDEAAARTEKNIDALVKVAHELLDVLRAYRKGTYRSRDGEGPAHLTFDQVFDYVRGNARDYFYGAQPGPEKLYLDLLHGGEYSKAMGETGSLCEGLAVIVKQRVALLDAILEKDFQRPAFSGDKMAGLASLKKLEEPLTVTFGHQELTLGELNAELRDLRHAGDAKHDHDRLEIDDLYTAFSRVGERLTISDSIRSLKKLTPLMAAMEQHLAELERLVGQLPADEAPDDASAVIGPGLRSAIVKLGRDMNDLGVLVQSVLSYAAEIRLTAQMAIRLAKDVARFIVENIVDESNKALPQWITLHAKLERIRA
ncbi:hypothetical protein [Paraburkholderia adhaesiva]|uniref:hypothetical protein n=1 Tax=Paraburkholderia adhaesiva TaxID=2883244 RepID=UPI001F3958BA|nr:hypothetical protein [Paraburkholderia adhaesiva]